MVLYVNTCTEKAQESLVGAQTLAERKGNNHVEPEQRRFITFR
jgi:hypothetical protein